MTSRVRTRIKIAFVEAECQGPREARWCCESAGPAWPVCCRTSGSSSRTTAHLSSPRWDHAVTHKGDGAVSLCPRALSKAARRTNLIVRWCVAKTEVVCCHICVMPTSLSRRRHHAAVAVLAVVAMHSHHVDANLFSLAEDLPTGSCFVTNVSAAQRQHAVMQFAPHPLTPLNPQRCPSLCSSLSLSLFFVLSLVRFGNHARTCVMGLG
jgi:hypothetical protein